MSVFEKDLAIILTVFVFVNHTTFADDTVQQIRIAPPASTTQVPEVTAQDRFLAPQAISALDISADGQFITVGTMAFSHEPNVWLFKPDGTVIAKRHFPPWAPLQVTTLAGGKALAVALAYSRVTSPDPTVWLGPAPQLWTGNLTEELLEPDSPDGQFARLRPGTGDWRTGWLASSLGELFVRGPDWLFKPATRFLDAEGQSRQLRYEDRNLLPTSRAMRMAASRDGSHVAFGWIGFYKNAPNLPAHPEAVSVWRVNPNRQLWSAPSLSDTPPPLPRPWEDFPDLATRFRLAPDALIPGHVTSGLAINRDGSRVAMIEHGIWGWVRSAPAIGTWDPPIHVLHFLPKQRGRLRLFDAEGREIKNQWLPAEGVFEVGFNSGADEVWCWPTAWFARGVAGAVWLPIDRPARTIYRFRFKDDSVTAFDFPDAVADVSISPRAEQVLVSCWNGQIYRLEPTGKVSGKLDAVAPARLAWSDDGSFAVAGTAEGRLLCLKGDGALAWSNSIPIAPVPPLSQPPAPVVSGLPIYQGGRIPGGEHAYVGDIWVIKAGNGAVLVDAGGTSGFSITQARLRALGIGQVTHVLQTHSHGDHCGGAYLWRTTGAQIIGAQSAALALTWLMPMLSDYGIYPPRPLDIALPLARPGDETDLEVSGLKLRALFAPGHSFDMTIFKIELAGKRIAFTGDLGFENQDILHRCWGDAEKARALVPVIREKLLAWHPDIVFTGHGVRTNGTEFITSLLRHTEESLRVKARDVPAR